MSTGGRRVGHSTVCFKTILLTSRDYPYKSRTGRMVAMVREVCALLCGLLVASDYKLGQATIENKNYADNQRLFQTIFEVGRTKCAQTMENSSSSSRMPRPT